jgi:hypothetical protein
MIEAGERFTVFFGSCGACKPLSELEIGEVDTAPATRPSETTAS